MTLDSSTIFIAMGAVILVQTIGLGLVIGYLVRAYIHDVTPQYTHPEMFDENGNPIAESLISFRFEGETPYLDEFDD
jgi:hypothetical protein|tara:strand:+ start:1911 stop:2141 length:231 start_codon:yes stop_codon:yes gene_type:complete